MAPKTALYINGSRSSNGKEPQIARQKRLIRDVCQPLGIECHRTEAIYMNENTGLCEGSTFKSKTGNGRHIQGLAQAHKLALEKVSTGMYGEEVIILEDDVVLPLEDTNRVKEAFEDYTQGIGVYDIAYLGNCHENTCMHAYVVTKDSASKMLRETDFCTGAIDGKIMRRCMRGSLDCKYPDTIEPDVEVKSDNQSGIIYQGPEEVLGSVKLNSTGNDILRNKHSVHLNSLYVDKPTNLKINISVRETLDSGLMQF